MMIGIKEWANIWSNMASKPYPQKFDPKKAAEILGSYAEIWQKYGESFSKISTYQDFVDVQSNLLKELTKVRI